MSYHHKTQLSHGWEYKIFSHPCRFSIFQNNMSLVRHTLLFHTKWRSCTTHRRHLMGRAHRVHTATLWGSPKEDKIFSVTSKTLLEGTQLSGSCCQIPPSPTIVAGSHCKSHLPTFKASKCRKKESGLAVLFSFC